MADGATTLLKLVRPEVGASDNTWGDKTNATLDRLDAIYRDEGGDLVTGGAANAYTVTPAFGEITAYADGLHFRARFHAAVTAASTLNFDNIGVADLKKKVAGVATATASGDGPVGHYGDFIYSETDTAVILLNPAVTEDVDTLKKNETALLSAGFNATDYDAGTKSSGTFTLDPALGNFQKCVNGGAFTLAPPATSCSIVLQVTNNASAGAVTTSGFTRVTGAAFSTTNGDDYICTILRINSFTWLHKEAMQ